ncbi:MAG TPA: biopolymer transporter ExbD [Rhodanobacter sp.]
MAFSARVSDDAVSQINVTPLVDVLLVLLVIFMITVPVVSHRVKLDLPQQSNRTQRPAEPVHLAIHADGTMSWNDVPIDAAAWHAELSVAAQNASGWSINIDAADGAPYQVSDGSFGRQIQRRFEHQLQLPQNRRCQEKGAETPPFFIAFLMAGRTGAT